MPGGASSGFTAMLARLARARRAWLGLLLVSLTPSAAAPTSAAPTSGAPVHWCIHDLFSTLYPLAAPVLRRGAGGLFPELP